MSLARFAPQELLRGFAYPLRGYRILKKHPGLARYWAWPMLLTALALVLSTWLALRYHDDLLRLVWSEPALTANMFVRGAYALVRALGFVLTLATLVVLCSVGSILLAAPFNDALSEAIEEREAGRPPLPFQLGRLVREVAQTLGFSVLRLTLYAAIVGPLWALSWFVPGVGQVLYLTAWLLFTAAYFALDFVDWPATRRGWSIRARFALLRAYPLRMFGFGCAVWLCLYVPLLNLAFMPLSVAGGTLLFLDLESGPLEAGLRTK